MRQPTRARSLNPAGFTLLQLLVVVTIIGLVSTIATVASWRAVISARDSHRVHALREVQAALELYWIDNRSYPDTGGGWNNSCSADYIPGLKPKYIAELPKDPLSCPGHDGYYYKSNGTDYKFQSHNESSTQMPGKLLLTFIDPAWDGGDDEEGYCVIDGDLTVPANVEHFALYTPGGACWR